MFSLTEKTQIYEAVPHSFFFFSFFLFLDITNCYGFAVCFVERYGWIGRLHKLCVSMRMRVCTAGSVRTCVCQCVFKGTVALGEMCGQTDAY